MHNPRPLIPHPFCEVRGRLFLCKREILDVRMLMMARSRPQKCRRDQERNLGRHIKVTVESACRECLMSSSFTWCSREQWIKPVRRRGWRGKGRERSTYRITDEASALRVWTTKWNYFWYISGTPESSLSFCCRPISSPYPPCFFSFTFRVNLEFAKRVRVDLQLQLLLWVISIDFLMRWIVYCRWDKRNKAKSVFLKSCVTQKSANIHY